MQNGYIENFNGKFRDECLNEHWFETMMQARTAISVWPQDFNEVRPHEALDMHTPSQPNQPYLGRYDLSFAIVAPQC